MAKLRGGLIQMGLKGSTDSDPETIRKAMIEAHLPLIEEAGKQGVADYISLWAGRGAARTRQMPAAELVKTLVAEIGGR